MATHLIEHNPLGVTAAVELLLQQERARLEARHHPMPLALCLQFWAGDQEEALSLARLLADIEPKRREDVALVFARRFDLPYSMELRETMLYCGLKMPVSTFASTIELTGHPDGCYGLWSGTLERMWEGYAAGRSPFDNVFLFEADGVPLTRDWIDRLKRSHEKNLQACKRVSGAVMQGNRRHVNGTLAMHLSFWADHPSLCRCPPGKPWDYVHAQTLLSEIGQEQPVRNEYGAQDVSYSVFLSMARDHSWLASVKDGSARKWAEKLRSKE